MGKPIFVVDAFADQPFEGNPAGVCLCDSEPNSDWMQRVAAEMLHAETAFVWPADGEFGLRWFTPTTEVALCGHATLAAATILFSEGVAKTDSVTFNTASGPLHCSKGDGGTVVMDFPATPPAPEGAPNLKTIAKALGLKDTAVDVLAYRKHWFVVYESSDAIAQIDPDYLLVAELGLRGMAVTAPSQDAQFDFVSRFFAPALGVPEDHVTGSAHCALGPYWSKRLGKEKLKGRQLSRRGGTVGVEVKGDRVLLSGASQVVLKGELRV